MTSAQESRSGGIINVRTEPSALDVRIVVPSVDLWAQVKKKTRSVGL